MWMIQGLTNFIEYFKEYEDHYVVIGGLATAMVMNELGFTTRATKDIDLVVISKENEEFIKRLLKFIDLAGYKTKQRTDNDSKHNLFRFFDSEDKTYPEQIELFAIHSDDSQIAKDNHIVPIQTPQYYDYLSAILLDTDYFKLLIEYTTKIEGLHVATPEVLIPLKIHAYLNLTKSRSQDAKKHLRDIVKLITLLDGDESVVLEGEPKKDFLEFFPIFEEIEDDRVKNILKNTGVGKVSKEKILELVKSVFNV